MAPDILLLGANGQVGWELRRSLTPVGRVIPLTRADLDFARLGDVVRTVRDLKPSIVVNAAAYTAVDKAETEEAAATHINVAVPAALAAEVKRLGGLYVDYSTDYVFDGKLRRPYRETDKTAPLSVYGRTKLEGLRAVEFSGCRYLIFRVSWVYGARGSNFVKTILRLARERTEFSVVGDQIGAPTPAHLIADVTAQALVELFQGRGAEGIYHLAPVGQTSWHRFAQTVVAQARQLGAPIKVADDAIRFITTDEYPAAAHRPANSVLDTGKLRTTFALHLPRWEEPLPHLLSEIISQ